MRATSAALRVPMSSTVVAPPGEHRPLHAVQTGYDRGSEAGYREESRAFGELAMSDVAKELMFLFFATS